MTPRQPPDPALRTLAGRLAAQDALDAAIAAWTRRRDAHEAMAALQAGGVTAGVVSSAADLIGDPHLLARESLVPIDRAHVGVHLYPGPAIRMRGTPPRVERPTPTLGEHNREILGGRLGLDEAALAALERDGVIGTAPQPIE